MIKLPEFSLLEKHSLGGVCDGCSRSIKHVYTLKNNKTQEVGHYGSGCAKNFMNGKSITEVAKENSQYKAELREEDLKDNLAKRVQSFKELNPEMLDYIQNNQDFSFLVSIKENIERVGTLSQAQFDVVYGMMLKVAGLAPKVKALTLDIFRVKTDCSDFGVNYTLFGETKDKELVRVFFSTLNAKNERYLEDKGILRVSSYGEYNFTPTCDHKLSIKLNGSFDGYKLKRVKLG